LGEELFTEAMVGSDVGEERRSPPEKRTKSVSVAYLFMEINTADL